MNRPITIELHDILELVNCAKDYGFADDVLLTSFADMTGRVSDEEIAEYADTFTTDEAREEGYDEGDRDEAIHTLTAWRDRYAKEDRR